MATRSTRPLGGGGGRSVGYMSQTAAARSVERALACAESRAADSKKRAFFCRHSRRSTPFLALEVGKMRVWVASLLFYSFVYAFCELLRALVGRQILRVPPAYVDLVYEVSDDRRRLSIRFASATAFLQFIGVVQICAPLFDVNVVFENYGLQGVFIEIIFIELVNALLQRKAVADPCPMIISFIKGRLAFQRLAIFVCVQFAAAYFAYMLVVVFWRIGVHPAHVSL